VPGPRNIRQLGWRLGRVLGGMPSAPLHHMATCMAFALCSLPKAASTGFRIPRGQRLSQISARGHSSGFPVQAVDSAGGGIDGIVPPGDGRGGRGRGDDGEGLNPSGDDPMTALIAWLSSDAGRTAAVASFTWFATVGISTDMAIREAKRLPSRAGGAESAALDSGPACFAGEWVLSGSENFDRYLESLGVSSLHRRYACSATVTHIIQASTSGGATELKVCVKNGLGTRCETCRVDGSAIKTQDARGADVIKVNRWARGAGAQGFPICETEVRHSINGLLHERRYIRPDGCMVMELTSPTGVKAQRIFIKRNVIETAESAESR